MMLSVGLSYVWKHMGGGQEGGGGGSIFLYPESLMKW